MKTHGMQRPKAIAHLTICAVKRTEIKKPLKTMEASNVVIPIRWHPMEIKRFAVPTRIKRLLKLTANGNV